KKEAAARAREARARLHLALDELQTQDIVRSASATSVPSANYQTSPGLDDAESVCSWDRGVNSWSDAESNLGDWSDDKDLQDGDGDGLLEENGGKPDVKELEGVELDISLEKSTDWGIHQSREVHEGSS
ncbi:hypothetical protein BC835DRAFT_1303166, partial [Cytidiella melzeri]